MRVGRWWRSAGEVRTCLVESLKVEEVEAFRPVSVCVRVCVCVCVSECKIDDMYLYKYQHAYVLVHL